MVSGPFGLRRDGAPRRRHLMVAAHARASQSAAGRHPSTIPAAVRRVRRPCGAPAAATSGTWSRTDRGRCSMFCATLRTRTSAKVIPFAIGMTLSNGRSQRFAREASPVIERNRSGMLHTVGGMVLFDLRASWRLPHIVWMLSKRRMRWRGARVTETASYVRVERKDFHFAATRERLHLERARSPPEDPVI